LPVLDRAKITRQSPSTISQKKKFSTELQPTAPLSKKFSTEQSTAQLSKKFSTELQSTAPLNKSILEVPVFIKKAENYLKVHNKFDPD